MKLVELSLTQVASNIRNGKLSAREYVGALFDHIDRVELRVQAWTTIQREAVLKEAEECDAEAREGRIRGPLHGIAVGVKDIFCTKQTRTTMGSPLFQDFIPDHDARAVEKLREAGAIIMGKTVTTAFAFLDPGPTRNPWNLNHTPGGSSSGSAAAVAARMCPAAIGTQTVGSVGRPAAFNGLASIMPTQRRVSRSGAFPLAWSLDHVGAFTRCVADLELMVDALADSPVERFPAPARLRIGIIRGFFAENMDAESRTLFDALVGNLVSAGVEVEEARLPSVFDLSPSVLRTILRSEAASVHGYYFPRNPNSYGAKLRELIETGMLVDGQDYLRACRIRRIYQREMRQLFDAFDVLMTPAARGAAPEGLGATGDPLMNAPWTLADFPTVTVPHALTASGMPLAVQLSGPPMQEGLLLTAARRVEEIAEFRAAPDLAF